MVVVECSLISRSLKNHQREERVKVEVLKEGEIQRQLSIILIEWVLYLSLREVSMVSDHKKVQK